MLARHSAAALWMAAATMVLQPAIAQDDWGAKIKQIESDESANEFAYFKFGGELASAPGREGIDALKSAWPSLKKTSFKQQVLKGWHFEMPGPFRTRFHLHALELYDMVLTENDPKVTAWVVGYVPPFAWQSFDTPESLQAWVAAHKSEAGEAAAIASMEAWAKRAAEPATRVAAMNDLVAIGYPLRKNPNLVAAAQKLNLAELLLKGIEDPAVQYRAVDTAYRMLAELDPATYPPREAEQFMEKYADRKAAQAEADRAAETARIMKAYDVRTIDGDANKRWIFHPPLGQTQPSKGWGLLIVMPGGDGSIGFTPFVGDTIRSQAGEDYAVIQLIAPPIVGDGNNAIVWPREVAKDARVDFTMEPIWRASIAAVKKEKTIDPDRVWVMGWSSGGPPSYEAVLENDSAVRGAFVIMSIFPEKEYSTIANAKEKAFYLLHSPQDFIKMSHPERAKEVLEGAGARVKLETYRGGHGWQGDTIQRIGEAVKWLEGK